MSAGITPPNGIGWFLYDATCGLCSRGVARSRWLLRRAGLDLLPLQTEWVGARLGLSPDSPPPDVRVLLVGGEEIRGADVYRFICRRIWWLSPVYLLSIIPGLRGVFNSTYRAVAQNRRQISRVCRLRPDCE